MFAATVSSTIDAPKPSTAKILYRAQLSSNGTGSLIADVSLEPLFTGLLADFLVIPGETNLDKPNSKISDVMLSA
jgi:hypothetical protein